MFEQPPGNLPIEDIFEKVDTAPKGGPGGGPPTTAGLPPRPGAIRPLAGGTAPVPVIESPGGGAKKIVLFVAISLVVVGVIGGAIYFLQGFVTGKQATPAPVVNVPAENTPAVLPEEPVENANIPVPALGQTVTDIPANIPVPPALVDSDADGLDDAQEISIGTDPELTDTDSDGLSDFDEVRTWLTDPLNPDTDGDGYKDGDEVKAGYDPKGPGKIVTSPQP